MRDAWPLEDPLAVEHRGNTPRRARDSSLYLGAVMVAWRASVLCWSLVAVDLQAAWSAAARAGRADGGLQRGRVPHARLSR